MRRHALRLPWLLILPLAAHAHDIPNARVDRSIQVSIKPGRLEVDYEVSLSELTLTQDLRKLTGGLPGADRRDWFAAYGHEVGPLNGRGLLVIVDGQAVELGFAGFELAVEDHPRFVFRYETAIPPRARVEVQDTNYAGSEGTSRLAVRGRDGVVIHGDELPDDVASIPIRPVWQLSDAEEQRTKRVVVDYEDQARLEKSGRARPSAAPKEAARSPLPPASGGSPGTTSPWSPGSTRLTRLLDRNDAVSLLGLVLVALGLGAAHALQPGHGKTLVAAAVLGEGGTWWRGVSLALITTLTHTGSVLLVALGLWWSRTQRYGAIHLVLAHAAGVVIAAIGLWRLGRHLGGFGEHDSPPGDVCLEEGVRAGAVAGRGVIALGIGGGLVPCWDAVVLIVLAEATGRLGLGIALLLAFGLGMALVLVAVGLLAGRIRQRLVRIRGVEAYGPWERGLGLAGGLVLAAIGIYLIGLT